MKGRLQDMAVADLIQHNCQDRKTVRIQLKNGREKGELFIKNGNVVHAVMNDQAGEDAIYRMMDWNQGMFELTAEVEAPAITITRNWTSLLLEAARLVDEGPSNGKPIAYFTDPSAATEVTYERSGDLILDLGIVTPQQMIEQFAQIIDGHLLTFLTQVKGNNLYWSSSMALNQQEVGEQMKQFVKMADLATARLQAGELQNLALTIERAYLFIHFLGRGFYYLLIAVDKEKANIGSLRHQTAAHTERLLTSLEAAGAL